MKRVHMLTLTGLMFSLTTVTGVLAETEVNGPTSFTSSELSPIPATVPTYSQDLEDKANAGNVIAQYQLGRVYSYGKGVQQDLVKALDWYQKAAAQGDADADKKMNEVTAILQRGPDKKTPEELGAEEGKSVGEQIWKKVYQE